MDRPFQEEWYSLMVGESVNSIRMDGVGRGREVPVPNIQVSVGQ